MGHQLLGYARVSTSDQIIDRQIDALTVAGVERIFTDHASGTRSSRPALDELLHFARAGDTIVVLSLDRLGRDTRQLLAWVDGLREREVQLRILQLGVDTATPAGKLVLTVMAALAAMEREVLVERTLEGLAAARARGRVGGRPAALSGSQKREALRMRASGVPTGEVAEVLGCSPRTVRRVLALAGSTPRQNATP